MKKKENKFKYFGLCWRYIKEDKIKFFLYILLVFSSYIPSVLTAYFWSLAIQGMTDNNYLIFVQYLIIYDAIFILCFTVLQIPRDALFSYFELKFMKNVSKDLYHKMNKLPAIAFEEIGVGEYINRLYTDTDRVMELLEQLIVLVGKALVAIVIVIFTFTVNKIIGLEFIILAIVMGFIAGYYYPKIKKNQEEIKKQSDQYVKVATENISGIREIKSLGIAKVVEKNLNQIIDKWFTHKAKVNKNERWYYALNNLTFFIIHFVILYTCGKLYFDGFATLATIILMDGYIGRIDNMVESLSNFGVSYNKITVSLKRISEILDNKLYADEKYGNKELKNIKGIIEFKDVKFRYRDNESDVLNGLNLKIVSNKKIAVVGRSGNGKSTIFNLLLRYFDCTEGSITIDNINIKDLTEESLRKNISIIRQSPFLFNLTIMDNLRYVKEDITLEEAREVCKKAYIDDYIMSLPDGYDTMIGEGGINLSGGQKQRLAIARTLLLKTKIILFDEATSALDNESQEYIKKTIDELAKDHTVIIVAHRLSTIVDADQIHVIDKGVLVGEGTHQELLRDCDIYRHLYTTENANS